MGASAAFLGGVTVAGCATPASVGRDAGGPPRLWYLTQLEYAAEDGLQTLEVHREARCEFRSALSETLPPAPSRAESEKTAAEPESVQPPTRREGISRFLYRFASEDLGQSSGGDTRHALLEFSEPHADTPARMRGHSKSGEVAVPKTLAECVRRQALEALIAATTPTASTQLWHGLALAEFLDPRRSSFLSDADRAEISRAALRAFAGERTTAELERMTLRVLPRLESIPIDVLQEAYAEYDKTLLRLLVLVQRGRAGDRGALEELATLSLEYGGRAQSFAHGMELCFPAPLNPKLYSELTEKPATTPRPATGAPEEMWSDARAIQFLARLQSLIPQATYRSGMGWQTAEER